LSSRSAEITTATITAGRGTSNAKPSTSSASIVSVENGQLVNSHSASWSINDVRVVEFGRLEACIDHSGKRTEEFRNCGCIANAEGCAFARG